MKEEQFNKILELREALKDAKYILDENYHGDIVTISCKKISDSGGYKNLQIIKPAFQAYIEKLKAELKELDYEV
jgi:hypothetical protein